MAVANLRAALISAAARLASEPYGSNPEYDRGQVELICDLLGISTDDREQVASEIRQAQEGSGLQFTSCSRCDGHSWHKPGCPHS